MDSSEGGAQGVGRNPKKVEVLSRIIKFDQI